MLRGTTRTAAVLVSTAALSYSLWPIILGVLFLACTAMAIVGCAAFSSRDAPMSRLRAFVRDLRGDRSSVTANRAPPTPAPTSQPHIGASAATTLDCS